MKQKTIPPQVVINEKLGDFFVDIAKLVFAGVVLSTLLDMEVEHITVLITGITSTGLLVLLGFICYKKKQ
ncbi:hypothetical protein M1P97_11605 [Parabacteroides sp. GYB001]|uniref:DUF6722 family protein n=1 Tax=Parabacteroides leei TaxID=2939491 RepID=UPI002017E611|nr:DUF6722 family protein [Parabacteroides leei]MCL3851934.1 hypothetical protein [Parabacteroides leei]